jgi:hypothetical protein
MLWMPTLGSTVVGQRNHISPDHSILSLLKVLQQLPEGLAIKVLAASPAGLDHHLSILPASLHPLAIEAAFPEVHREDYLDLDISPENFTTACAVLHAVSAKTEGFNALKKLNLHGISVDRNGPLGIIHYVSVLLLPCIRSTSRCCHDSHVHT